MIKIYSRVELSDNTKSKIYQFLHRKYPERNLLISHLNFFTDKNILSGIKIDVDSHIIDLTLNQRLSKVLSQIE